MMRRILLLCGAICLAASAGGCAIAKLGGAMAQSAEYQKKIEVRAKYADLEGHRVAVLVDAELGLLFEHQNLVAKISAGVAERLRRDVPDIQVLNPDGVLRWQYQTAQWNVMPFGEMAEALGVTRIVHIEIYEYRLHPPGNRWLWDGACGGTIGVIEADGVAPEVFAESFEVVSKYPDLTGVTRENASAAAIEFGVLHGFIKHAAWLFHDHVEPKYPDQYQPEMDAEEDRVTS